MSGNANSGRQSDESIDEAWLSGCIYELGRIEAAVITERTRLESVKRTEKTA